MAEGGFLMLQSWPVAREALDFPEEEKAMELIMDLIRAVRTRRSEMNVPPSKKARLTVATAEEDTFRLGEAFLKKLAYASEGGLRPRGHRPRGGLRHRGHPRRPGIHAPWRSWWTWRRRRPAWRRS